MGEEPIWVTSEGSWFIEAARRVRWGVTCLTILSTGCNAVSPRQNVDGADEVGVVLESALDAGKFSLSSAIVCRDMAAVRAGSACFLWRDGNESSAVPVEFVLELTTELEPSLVENGLVESGFGPNVGSRCLPCPGGRCRQVAYLQILDADHRVVFADGGRGLVQVVASGIADSGMDALDPGFCLVPVGTEFCLSAHRTLGAAQTALMATETRERCEKTAIGEGRKPGNTDIDTNSTSRALLRRLHFPFGLDGDEPFSSAQTHGDVLDHAEDVPALAVAHPSDFGQEDAAIGLVELGLLRRWVAQAFALPLFLESGKCSSFGEEVRVGPIQILQRLLQRVRWRIGKPPGFFSMAPPSEFFAKFSVPELFFALFVALFLQRKRPVPYKPAGSSELAHFSRLFTVWP